MTLIARIHEPQTPESIRAEVGRRLRVGEHVIDIGALRIVTRADGARLTPKSLSVLLELARRPGQTLTRDELLDRVWKDSFPTPDVLTQAIKELRRGFCDDLRAPRYIETIPKVGYRLIAPVAFVAADEPASIVPTSNVFDDFRPNGHAPAELAPARARPTSWPLVATAVVLLAIAVFAVARLSAPTWEPPRYRVDNLRAITSDPGAENFPRVSPDGSRVAYSARVPETNRRQVLLRSLEQSRVLPLGTANEGDELYPVWSHDGASIAFMRYRGKDCEIVMTPSLGGQERHLARCFGGTINYFDLSPDGKALLTSYVASADTNALMLVLVPFDGTDGVLNYDHGPTDQDLDPRYSPDGRRIAFRRGVSPFSDLWLANGDGSGARQVTHLSARIRGYDWTHDGRTLVFSSNHEGPQMLYAVDVDDGRVDALGVGPALYPSAAREGDTVVYEIPRTRSALTQLTLANSERADIAASTGSDSVPALSPSGDALAFISDRSGSQELWRVDIATGTSTLLSDFHGASLIAPVWRADGARMLVTARQDAHAALVELDPSSREQHAVTPASMRVRYGIYGPEAGSYLVVAGGDDGHTELVLLKPEASGGERQHVLARGVGRIDFDPVTHQVYFTKVAQTGLFRMDPGGGEETLVTRAVTPAHLDGWRVVDGAIWYLEPRSNESTEIYRLDVHKQVADLVGKVPFSLADLNFAVDPKRGTVVLSYSAAEDTDIGAFTLTRSGRR